MEKLKISYRKDSIRINGKVCKSKKSAMKELSDFLSLYPFKHRKNSGKKVKIFCVENGKTYRCAHDAENDLGLIRDTVSRCAGKRNKNGKLKIVKGYHFERV